MKRLWPIIMVFVLLAPILAAAEKMVEIPESELKEYLDRLEQDRETIKTLRAENYTLKIDKMNLQAEATRWKQADDKQMGFYLGGATGYPFVTAEAIALYKFRQWGLILTGGYYHSGFAVNAGVLIKTK